MVEGGAVAIPGGDASGQAALNCAAVELIEVLMAHAKCLESPEIEETIMSSGTCSSF